MLLQDKVAIIYGAGGAIGSATARNFGAEGATVYLAGRSERRLLPVVAAVTDAGGKAYAAAVDALDEQAVDTLVRDVVAETGSLDISLNLISRGDLEGIPLVRLSTADFLQPVSVGLTTNFLTARAAARQMIEQGDGVILALNSGSAQGSPLMGGTGPADAAIDSLIRNLAFELGPSGVRVTGVWTAGIPETFGPEYTGVNPQRDSTGLTPAQLDSIIGSLSMLKRAPRLADVVSTLTFLASDHAASITGTFVNASAGIFPG
jgi:NAD(P)-dependent dehydrogenase (short-subunit alcohol dehydrogenase family)